jgi:hypothetical protein
MKLIALIAFAAYVPLAATQEPPARESLEPAVTTSPTPAPRPVVTADPAPAPAPAARTPAAAATAAPGAAAPKPGGSKGVMDRLELDATQITGNRELPKVLYIVPWKQSDLGDLMGRPANSLLDEVLAPVDRDVFRRENRYYDALQPDAAQRTDKAEK